MWKKFNLRREAVLILFFLTLIAVLLALPTGYEARMPMDSVRCRAEVTAVENAELQQLGLIRTGHQDVTLRLLDAPYKGRVVEGANQLMGRMDLDKVYQVGDRVLVVLTLDPDGKIIFVNPQDHYRLGLEVLLLGLFSLLLLIFGGWTGFKALLSFVFSGLTIWKIVVPLLLKGWDPLFLALGAVALMTAAIIFLVAGLTHKGLAAFLGAFLGVLTSCLLASFFTGEFHLHGAVLPFAETLLYSGFAHLNLSRIFVAAVFFAASGAVMDLAMDVAASMEEVAARNPGLSRGELIRSGLSVGRAVVGTMTTTLLLAYSGGYITLLMAFMAQGVPPANMFNLIYVAAEVVKTLIGSFGLVTVAPFTALIGSLVFAGKKDKVTSAAPVALETLPGTVE